MIRSFQFSECRRRSLLLPGIESFIAWIIYENGRGTEERSRVEFQGQPKLHCARSLQRRELLFFTPALSAAIIFCKIRLRYGELFLIHNYLVHNYPSLDVGTFCSFFSQRSHYHRREFDSEVSKKLYLITGGRMLLGLSTFMRDDDDINSGSLL